MAAAQKVRDLKSAGRAVIDLGVGEPDFDTPDHIKRAAVAALQAGQTKYTPVNGIPALRKAIVERVASRTGVRYDLSQVSVGGGAKQVIFLALMATVEEGTEVIVPSPYWVSYPEMVLAHGGTPIVIDCAEEEGFLLTAAQLEQAISPATRWLILNAPGNPTGAVYTAERLAELAGVLRRHPHVMVLCDEIYDEIVFTDDAAASLLSVAPDLCHHILLVNGVSKSYAMTGWRLGWGLGPQALIDAINTLQSHSSSCPSSLSQAAAVAALTGDQGFVGDSVREYRHRRDLVHSLLADIDGLDPVLPGGSFYLFVGCRGLLSRHTPDGALLTTDQDVVLYLLEQASVATIQGSAYGASPYFRLSFATSESALKDAAAQIGAAVSLLS